MGTLGVWGDAVEKYGGRRRLFSTVGQLLSLALPLAAGMLFQVAFNLVDAYFIGRLGTDAFAAVNLASFSVWLLSGLVGIVGTGANARVAQCLGGGRMDRVVRLRGQAIRASLAVGVLTSLIGLLGAEPLTLYLSGREEESRLAAVLTAQYLSIIFLAAPLLCFNETMSALFRGTGDTRTPTKILSLGFVVNAVLDPLLIFGFGPIPGLGVVGAALASILSFLFSSLLFALVGREWFRKREEPVRWALDEVPGMISVGLPPSITNIVFCVVYMGVTPHIASMGTEALAALGLGHKVISLSYFLCLSFSLAAITLTGQSTGAEDKEEALYRSWVVVGVATFTNALVGSGLVYFSPAICSLFSDDPVVLSMAAAYLKIVVPSQVLLGIGMSVEGAFAGFGKTTSPMVISVISSVARWPAVAWVVASGHFGIHGVWWVFALSTYFRGLALFFLLFGARNENRS